MSSAYYPSIWLILNRVEERWRLLDHQLKKPFSSGGPMYLYYFLYLLDFYFYLFSKNKFDMLTSLWQIGMNFDAIRRSSSIIHVFPFNSEKKRGGVALKLVWDCRRFYWKYCFVLTECIWFMWIMLHTIACHIFYFYCHLCRGIHWYVISA